MISDHEQYLRLKSELNNDEQLIWTGRPVQGILFRKSDFFKIPFSILCASGVLAYEAGAIWMLLRVINTDDTTVKLIIGLFILVGVLFGYLVSFILVGRFVKDKQRRQNTYYGLTDKKLMILTNERLISTHLNEKTEVRYIAQSEGRGTIEVASIQAFFDKLFGGLFEVQSMKESKKRWMGEPRIPTLEAIENGKYVYDMVVKIVKKSNRRKNDMEKNTDQ